MIWIAPVKMHIPFVILVLSLHGPLFAEDSTAVSATATAPAGESVFGEQSFFGPPYIAFGRHAAGSDLPGYVIGTFSYINQFDSDFDTLPGEVSAQDLSLWAPFAGFNFDDFHIVALLGYRMTKFDTSLPNMLTENTLNAFYLPVVFLKDVSEEWIYGGMVMPGFSGDLESGDNFSISAAFAVGHAFGPNFHFFGGVYYSHGFDDDTIIPGIGFTWRPTPKYEVYLIPPFGGISYSINECWMLSLSGQYDSPTWNVGADLSGPDRDITYQTLRIGVKLERRINDHFWAYINGGVSLAKNLNIEDTSNNRLLESDVDPGGFVQLGLNLRF